MLKKLTAILLLVSVASFFISGCSFGESTLNLKGCTIQGEVTNVDGKTVTLSIGQAGGGAGGMQMGNPPDKPDGAKSSGSADTNSGSGNAAPQNSDHSGEPSAPSQQTPSTPEGGSKESSGNQTTATLIIRNEKQIQVRNGEQTKQGSLSDITKGCRLEITFGSGNKITGIVVESGQGNGNGSTTETNGTSANTIDTDQTLSGVSYHSEKTDENALRVEKNAKATLLSVTVSKTGDSSSSENSDFYGLGAGILARDGSTLTLSDSHITTDAKGGNGVFVYGSGSTLEIANTQIVTSKDNAGGVDAAGGSTVRANSLDIQTSGNSAAAIRSDRGGADIQVTGGKYITNGTGSPAIYSTAAIQVKDAVLQANHSEAVVIEGKNSVSLTNCNVEGSMSGTYGPGGTGSSENIHNIMLYQSMSGDADQGESSFEISGGSLKANAGDMFYVTNTSCSICLKNKVAIQNADGNFLTVAGNSGEHGWGTSGSNGGNCTLSLENQSIQGAISVDSISSLKMSLKSSSAWEGTVNPDGQQGTADITLDDTSSWTLTADAHISQFSGNVKNIHTNGHHVYVNGNVLV